MSGDLTSQGIKRITYLPERDDKDNGTIIGGQEYTNIYAIGGTITGVTLNPLNLTVLDNAFTIQDNVDITKTIQFQASTVLTGTQAVFSVPPASTTLVGTDSSQILTNKTINGANNTLTVRLANDVTGTLPVGNGGTGAITLTGYVKGTGTAALTASATIPSTDISGLGSMATQNANSVAITGGSIAGVSFNASNTGFSIQDTNASHSLIISPGSDLSANRTFTITTGDADRTLTMSGNATISGTNTGDQTITLTGDVTGSGIGSFAATIANGAVTYAKMQDVSATSRILGRRSSGAGDVEENTLSQVLDMVGSAADGDMLIRSGGTWTRLPIGASGQGLIVSGGIPAWGGSGGMTQIATSTPTGVSVVDFTSIPQTYAALVLQISGISCNTSTRRLLIECGWNAALGNPASNLAGFYQLTGTTLTDASNGTVQNLFNSAGINQAAAETTSATFIFTGYQSGAMTLFTGQSVIAATAGSEGSSGTRMLTWGNALNASSNYFTGALSGIRLYWSGSGNFDAGTVTLYGVS